MPDPRDPHELNEPNEPKEPNEPVEPTGGTEPFDLDETIIVARPAEPTGPIELTGPPESVRSFELTGPPEIVRSRSTELTGPVRPAEQPEEAETVSGPPEELRVVPVEPYYADFPEQDTPPEQPEESAQRPRPERIKRAAVVGARVLTGTIGVLVAAAVVTAAAIVPLPSYTAEVPRLEVTPVETGQQLVCPGSVLALSDSAETDASATTAVGDVNVIGASTSGEVSDTSFADSDSGSGGTEAAPQLLAADADSTAGSGSGETTMISGSQEQSVNTDALFGLAVTGCGTPSVDSWLVGGASTTGRSTLITLSNPSAVAASVDLEIFGELGTVTAPGLTGISVEPGAQRVLSLAGFAPQVASPVVHVTSVGGLVVATLQQSTIRGIEAGGLDLVGASAEPSTTNVIPGVLVSGADAVASRLGVPGYEDLTPTLRIYVPGPDTTEARVSVQSEDGAVSDSSFSVEVSGGVTVDFPIDDLVDGNYTISVDSDAPVVVGARTAVVGSADFGSRTDFAWFASATELQDEAMVSMPASTNSVLNLANPTGDAVTVQVTAIAGSESAGTQGATRSVEVAGGTSTTVPVELGASYQLSDFDTLHASVTATSDGGVAGYPVSPRAEASTPIVIYP